MSIDLFMPSMGGVQVLDRLADAGCDARVIIASGADANQIDAALEHARAKGLSVAGALTKPFTIDTLRDLLCKCASHRNATFLMCCKINRAEDLTVWASTKGANDEFGRGICVGPVK